MSTPVKPTSAPTSPVFQPKWSNLRILEGDDAYQAVGTKSPVGPVIFTVVVHLGLLFAFAVSSGDISSLMYVGEAFRNESAYQSIKVFAPDMGYEGQYFYVLAQQNPFAKHLAGVDVPAYRQLCIAYPALSWLFSGGGRPDLLVWVMPLLNLLAIAGLAWLGSNMAVRNGLSAWWGILVPLAANAALPALRNLTDVVTAFAVCSLFYCWLTRASLWCLVPAALLTAFSRELGALLVGIVLVGCLWQRRWTPSACLAVVLSLWGAWVGYLWNLYETPPFMAAAGNLAWPFEGILFRWEHVQATMPPTRAMFHRIFLAVLVIQLPVSLYFFRVCRDPVLLAAAVVGAAWLVVGGTQIYADMWSCLRAFNWLAVVLCLGLLQARRPTLILPMALLSLSSFAAVISILLAPA